MTVVYWKGYLGVSYNAGWCVLREWVVRGGGLDRHFGEQELPVATHFTEDTLTISAGSLF